MKYYSQYRNHDLFDLQELLSRFCKSNRWVKLGDNLPWDNIVREYNKRLQYRHAGADNKTASYSLAMGYDNMHRITSKKQHLSQTSVQFDGTLNAGYDLTYTYQKGDGKKFQLDNVRDINYRTEETPTESTNINNGHKYTYDANGNLVYINTSRVKKDGKEDEKASEQKYRWDEENRLLAVDENGFVSNYWYDADGERTVKTSGENEAIYVNSEFSGGKTGTARFSLYVSPYLVAGQGGKYTKHIYVGSQRIVSKLGDLASYGADPRRIPYAGNEADGLTINYKDKYNQQLQSIKDNYKTFDQPYNGKDNDDYVNGQGFCCDDNTPEAAQARAMAGTRAARTKAIDGNFKPNDDYEKMQFYYHPDHLGSSSYITNLDGEVTQHIEYLPFGEVFIEERNNTWNTSYLFNAKEFDEETGMYYYGARYYEPRLSLWMSVDPISNYDPRNSENYLEGEHNNGVFNQNNLNAYIYCYNNPIVYVDPNGKQTLAPALPRFLPRTITLEPLPVPIPAPPIMPIPQSLSVPNGTSKPYYKIESSDWSKVNLKDTKTWPKPPVEGKLRDGKPSRKKPLERGEKSLYDDRGGEWRPHLPDKYHQGHWDYKPAGKNVPWQNVYPSFVLPKNASLWDKVKNQINKFIFKVKLYNYQKEMHRYEQQVKEHQPIS